MNVGKVAAKLGNAALTVMNAFWRMLKTLGRLIRSFLQSMFVGIGFAVTKPTKLGGPGPILEICFEINSLLAGFKGVEEDRIKDKGKKNLIKEDWEEFKETHFGKKSNTEEPESNTKKTDLAADENGNVNGTTFLLSTQYCFDCVYRYTVINLFNLFLLYSFSTKWRSF